MSRIQIVEIGEKGCHAGTKAVEDVCLISKKLGFEPLNVTLKTNKLTLGAKIYRQVGYIFDWKKNVHKIKSNDIVLLQFPFLIKMLNRENSIKLIKKKNAKIITIIHDVEELRGFLNNSYAENDFNLVLEYSDIFIVHNERMKEFFVSKNISPDRVVVLEIFDYLYDLQHTKKVKFSKSIVVAGNLNNQKSPYIKQLEKLRDIDVILYGPNYDSSDNTAKSLHYKGVVSPDILPSILDEGFGLVWDGTSIDTCDGPAGNYLKYNNPHKLSLYLVAGLPVIIWKQAAEAEFVEKNHLGICVDSLRELEDIFAKMTEDEYLGYCYSVEKISRKIATGEYMTYALKKGLTILSK